MPKVRILLIEADLAIAQPILRHLSIAGMECRWAPDGSAGLAAYQAAEPHLVLLDATLPDVDSRQVVTKIRESKMIPIIGLVQAGASQTQLEECLPGVEQCIPTTSDPQLILERVVAQLKQSYAPTAATAPTPQTSQVTPQAPVERAIPTDVAAKEKASAATATAASMAAETNRRVTIPVGWGHCENCGYMGPRHKFENPDRSKGHTQICPVCQEIEDLTFCLG